MKLVQHRQKVALKQGNPLEANNGFEDIQFDLGKATIRPESYSILDNAAKIMISEQLPNAKFEIGGHTDSKGSMALNNKLFQSRADSCC